MLPRTLYIKLCTSVESLLLMNQHCAPDKYVSINLCLNQTSLACDAMQSNSCIKSGSIFLTFFK